MSGEQDPPRPDQITGAPHPRESQTLFGQSSAEADFLNAYTTGRLHSGWLIAGPQGVGKATLAWKIATFLLAEPPADAGLFGETPPPPTSLAVSPENADARLVQSGAHPRLYVLRRVMNKTETALQQDITLAALCGHDDGPNTLKAFLHMRATEGGRRVIIIDCADEMNRTVANSILKELEEPPANTTFILVSHQPSGLLPTIRSRCRVLRCAPLGHDDMAAALHQAGIDVPNAESLATLSGGSVGEAVRLLQHDGLALYGDLVKLFGTLPDADRQIALSLANSCAGKGAEVRFAMTLDLVDRFLSRTAHAGISGPPATQAAPHEALLLAKLSPTDRAARMWAQLGQDLTARSRHGRAVNLDPAALILDMIFKIEATARKAVKA